MNSSAGVVKILLVLFMIVVPLAGGVLLIVFSRRRRPTHPACGNCGYNVHGSIGSVIRCPECGADFARVGITPPRGKRNPLMVTAGVALIVLTMGCLSSSLLYQRAAIAQSQAAAQKAAAQAAAAQAETPVDPKED